MSSSPDGAPNVTLTPEKSLGVAIETETFPSDPKPEPPKRAILHLPSTGDRSVALLKAENALLELRLRRRTRGSEDYARDARDSMRRKIENWQIPDTDHKTMSDSRASRGRR